MSENDQLDPELENLFKVERNHPAPEPATAVLTRVKATIASGSPDGGGSNNPPTNSSSLGNVGNAGSTPGGSGLLGVIKRMLYSPIGTVVTFALGTGSGAALHAKFTGTSDTIVNTRTAPQVQIVTPTTTTLDASVSITQVPVTSAVDASIIVNPVGSPDAGRIEVVRNTTTPRTDGGTVRRVDSLAQENALITRAQNALARGRADSARQALTEHRARFPSGQFAEERDALWIQVLARQGDIAGAQQSAAQFRSQHPRSLLRPVVETVTTHGRDQ